jgi:hypothetical protein
MNVWTILAYACIAAVAALGLSAGLRALWLAVGAYRIHHAGPRPLSASRHTIWRDPGVLEQLDLIDGPGGPGGAPAPPYHFIEEHLTGSQPCVSVRDARGRRWRVKWGNEVRAENFAVRLVWACGYYAETTYFVASGLIEGAVGLQRARGCIGDDCRFADARFELDDPAVRKMFEEHSWAWNDNPFIGSPPWAESARDAPLGLGHEGSTRRGARIEYRHFRAPGRPMAARSALPHHGLGRIDGALGRQHRDPGPVGSGRVRGAERGVRHGDR